MNYTEEIVKKLHELLFVGLSNGQVGCYRSRRGFIIETEPYGPEKEKITTLMKAFMSDLNAKKDSLHPVLLAAFAHKRLVDIHPFADGNAKTARLLMNLVLVRNGYQVVSIPPERRHEYIIALIAAQDDNYQRNEPFDRLIAECVLESQRNFCRMFRIPLTHLQLVV